MYWPPPYSVTASHHTEPALESRVASRSFSFSSRDSACLRTWLARLSGSPAVAFSTAAVTSFMPISTDTCSAEYLSS